MKTGFTCAAGFNVVASATHGGRRLIAVVLGSPSAKERTAEAASLFDRGFAQWGGGAGSVENLPSPGVNSAPDMHGEICSRRGRAAMVAGEEEEATAPIAAGARVGTRGMSMYSAAVVAEAVAPRALAAMEPVHFDPVPVFLGPKPGWTGPILAARPVDPTGQKAAVATPPVPDATAYASPDKPQEVDKDETPPLSAPTAPMALHAAVKPAVVKALVSRAARKRPVVKIAADQNKAKLKSATVPTLAKPAGGDKSPPPVQ
jgi:D-alanyl-D-alanine carboxypeptidase